MCLMLEDVVVYWYLYFLFFFDMYDFVVVMVDLYGCGIQCLFVEGGFMLVSVFFVVGFVDQVFVYIVLVLFGGECFVFIDIGVFLIVVVCWLMVDGWVLFGDDLFVVVCFVEENELYNEGVV